MGEKKKLYRRSIRDFKWPHKRARSIKVREITRKSHEKRPKNNSVEDTGDITSWQAQISTNKLGLWK